MKSITLFWLLVLFFFLNIVKATGFSFNGDWSGEGRADTPRSERVCSEIFFRLEETKETLSIINAGYSCQDLQAQYPYSQFDKTSRGELLYKGKVVGSYDDKSFSLVVPQEFYRLDVVLNQDGGLTSKEVWDDSRTYLYVQGSLESLGPSKN